MSQTIAIKDFRQNLAKITDLVEQGEIIHVFRRSKKSFTIVPAGRFVEDEWETVIDFTDNGKKKGEDIKNVLQVLKKMNSDDYE